MGQTLQHSAPCSDKVNSEQGTDPVLQDIPQDAMGSSPTSEQAQKD